MWSDHPAHEPLVSVEDFEDAQTIRHAVQSGKTRERTRVHNTYVLRGLFCCALCGRKMQGQHSHGRP
ncbi:MAG TPA: hypothetical protein VFU65_11505 [Actinocrinis sp.]|nr:hypothetical protein [Actinocrinis sp.]